VLEQHHQLPLRMEAIQHIQGFTQKGENAAVGHQAQLVVQA
jgi:hypothetical protein